MIDLTKYCAPEHELREELKKPFECDGYYCATDGAMIVMVKEWDGLVGIGPDYDKLRRVVGLINATYKGYKALDDIEEPKRRDCEHCGGSGKVTICPDCGGKGAVECDRGHLHDCDKCASTGVLNGKDADCDECDGKGWRYADSCAVRVLGGYMNYKYVAILKDLGAKIVQSNKDDPVSMFVFRFPGGRGGVMPMVK